MIKSGVIAVIPARYGSQRLPGKPLLDINGKPLLYYPYTRAKESGVFDEVIIATDDKRIVEVANGFGARAIMTSSEHETGTDRVAEVAAQMEGEIFVNIQGDEIGIKADALQLIAEVLVQNPDYQIANLVAQVKTQSDLINPSVVKVSVNRLGDIMYYTRSPIPHPKSEMEYIAYRQIGLYAFRRDLLLSFSKMVQTPIEKIEGVELLRLLENGIKIKAVIGEDSFDVDTQDDLNLARQKVN